MERYFFDSHMHAMNLTHPNFVSFVDSIADNITEFITSGALSPGYLLTPSNRGQQGLITLLNMFSLFEQPIAKIFAFMEADLKGQFESKEAAPKAKQPHNLMYPPKAYIRDGKFYFRDVAYDKYALIPLVMDFSRLLDENDAKAYYTTEKQEKLIDYVKDTLAGIESYKKENKEGLLEFFPFLGINTEVHSLEFIKKLLQAYIRDDFSVNWSSKRNKQKQFRGIKLYPPLGTNPWPEEKDKLKKIRYIYQFCESKNIAIITHCDDQGFRGVNAKLAQQYTNPSAWKVVLEHYPKLKIDFAHYGRQYNPIGKSPLKVLFDRSFTSDPWFLEIIELMISYENVYADFSFSGTDPLFYENLYNFIKELDDKKSAQRILERSLFGSDFMINLAKVESYSNYLRIFELSPFSDQEINLFVSENPMRFLSLN
ncbi:MAG: amidohydrolase family protein [Sphaerochaetaceae bacterium]